MEAVLAESGDLTIAFEVERSADAVFAAINNVRGWWSQNIEGETYQLGAEFVFHNEPIHYTKFRITEFDPGRRVVWQVLDSMLSFTADPREWDGDRLVFDIVPQGESSEVTFTQMGLVPAKECFEVCQNAWSGYIKGSLRGLILYGQGAPIPARS
jgi:hypothetical protein